ncbi:MAG: hypothetical protein ACP5I1_05535 [Candidatus Hinthialibacter sp.]
MSEKPAVLISDKFIERLTDHAICDVSFRELSGKTHPCEVKLNAYQEIRSKLSHIETTLRTANPIMDITCVVTGQGVYWLAHEGMEVYLKNLEEVKKRLDEGGAYPIWKMTSTEIFTSHEYNLRQLILAAAHDMVLLDLLKDSLGEDVGSLQNEFEICERRVRILLENMVERKEDLNFILSPNIVLYERIRITREMVNRGMLQFQNLGYNLQDLDEAQSSLEKRCAKDFPTFHQRERSAFDQIKESLRQGECAQLRRVDQLDKTFIRLGAPPIGFQSQARLAHEEREALVAIVKSRESELGESDIGQKALIAAGETAEPVPARLLRKKASSQAAGKKPGDRKDAAHMAIMERLKKKTQNQTKPSS